MLRLAGRGILIGFAMAACVMCLKARQAQSPMGLARELQRNLSIVNIAAVRRRGMPRQSPRVVRTVAAGRPTTSPTDLIPGMQYQVVDSRRM
jgi:hypothetical protein